LAGSSKTMATGRQAVMRWTWMDSSTQQQQQQVVAGALR
jgi:hypothetical protein